MDVYNLQYWQWIRRDILFGDIGRNTFARRVEDIGGYKLRERRQSVKAACHRHHNPGSYYSRYHSHAPPLRVPYVTLRASD